MKLKGLTKLALSGVALAAVAATLGTSTYAWYVSNSTATVEQMNATTAGSESGNVMLCQLTEGTGKVLNRTGNWGNKLGTVSFKNTIELSPVSKDATGTTPSGDGVTATGWHDKDLAPVAIAKTYGYFGFGLWSTDATKIDIKFGAENTTTNFKYQTAYATGNVGGKAVNDSFTIDAMNALRVEVFQVEFKDDNTETVTLESALAGDALGTYCPADTFVKPSLSGAYASPTGVENMIAKGGSTDANEYYKQIMSEYPAGGHTEASTATLDSGTKTITIGQNTVGEETTNKKYIILLRYWLEGTDKECFDSCIGQTFAFNLEFTVHQEQNNG